MPFISGLNLNLSSVQPCHRKTIPACPDCGTARLSAIGKPACCGIFRPDLHVGSRSWFIKGCRSIRPQRPLSSDKNTLQNRLDSGHCFVCKSAASGQKEAFWESA
jgi:hypothetical protein